MSVASDVVNAPAFVFWAITAAVFATSVFALVTGFRALLRARLIEDVPTARVRSAHQGYVELAGTAVAMEGEPIIAPLSGVRCCWYRFRIEEKNERSWTVRNSGVSDDLFLLRDDTGSCVVDPDGAEITPQHKEVWYSDVAFSGTQGLHQRSAEPDGLGIKMAVAGLKISTAPLALAANYRFVEEVLLTGDPLYVIGQFRTLDDIDHQSHHRALTAEILREWKQRPDTLRERFDDNRDGVVDADEWEHARDVAARQAAEENAAQAKGQHLHTVTRPRDRGQAYLISNVPEFDLVRRYRYRAVWRLVLFFVAGAAATWMLTQRFVGV